MWRTKEGRKKNGNSCKTENLAMANVAAEPNDEKIINQAEIRKIYTNVLCLSLSTYVYIVYNMLYYIIR